MDKKALKAFCRELGLTEVGVAPSHLPVPDPFPEVCPLAAGKGLERYDLTTLLPGCRGAVVILFPYRLEPSSGSNLSCYCQIPDYHPVVREYLEKIAGWMEGQAPGSRQLAIVDTSPLAERDLAVQAGLGFLGDNGCLINDTWGSWCFIGAVLTTQPLEPDRPLERSCRHCGACARVCPHNQQVPETPLTEFRRDRLLRLDRQDLENLTNRQFRERYGSYAFAWRGKKLLLRNLELVEQKEKEQQESQ